MRSPYDLDRIAAMFEAALYDHDHADAERIQRLTLAAAIALTLTAAGLASVATLDRLGIDRVHGPKPQLEVLSLSSVLTPEPIAPPPPPPAVVGGGVASDDVDPEHPTDPDPSPKLERRTPPIASTTVTDERAEGASGEASPFGELGCPPGMRCDDGPGGGGRGPGPGGGCLGPNCATTQVPPSTAAEPAPTQVAFTALRCLACADPDPAALRKLAGTVHQRRGRVRVDFCVDRQGRVEQRSIAIRSSYGVAAVDRITTAAVERWRFAPLKVAGTPRRACSSAQFNIRFDGPT
jgi:TonB family protein